MRQNIRRRGGGKRKRNKLRKKGTAKRLFVFVLVSVLDSCVGSLARITLSWIHVCVFCVLCPCVSVSLPVCRITWKYLSQVGKKESAKWRGKRESIASDIAPGTRDSCTGKRQEGRVGCCRHSSQHPLKGKRAILLCIYFLLTLYTQSERGKQ